MEYRKGVHDLSCPLTLSGTKNPWRQLLACSFGAHICIFWVDESEISQRLEGIRQCAGLAVILHPFDECREFWLRKD